MSIRRERDKHGVNNRGLSLSEMLLRAIMAINKTSILLGLFLSSHAWLPAARADTLGNEGDDWAALHASESLKFWQQWLNELRTAR